MRNVKKNVMIAFGVFIMLSAFNSPIYNAELIKWESKEHYFGLIEKGAPVHQTFYFVNDTEKPIKIVQTKTSCGCTVTEHTKGEIQAGEKGFVKAEYNAAKSGVFSKTVSVYTSLSEEPFSLKIMGEVK